MSAIAVIGLLLSAILGSLFVTWMWKQPEPKGEKEETPDRGEVSPEIKTPVTPLR